MKKKKKFISLLLSVLIALTSSCFSFFAYAVTDFSKDYTLQIYYYDANNEFVEVTEQVQVMEQYDVQLYACLVYSDGTVWDMTTSGMPIGLEGYTVDWTSDARYLAFCENNDGNVKNLTVESCSFKNCFQGVYTQKINGITVMNSSFDTTAHNAIAVQSGSDAVNHKAVVITGNTFANIGDRIIRFGDVGADTQITIKNNTATNSGDSSGQVMKAQSLAEGVTYNISGNNWGEGKTVANTELTDR